MKILVTNDDGVRSEGIRALAAALSALGEVTVVAPAGESSAIGHALTLARPLRLDQLEPTVYMVDGTPTDCVNIALTQIYPVPPDLVVSGINKGYNIGDDITYSGTVAGALEGTLLGIPAMAISMQRGPEPLDFSEAASVAADLAGQILERGLPHRTFLNVNVPRRRRGGYRVTIQATRNHVTSVTASEDPRGRAYFWIEEGENNWEPHDQSDYQAVRDGFVSVTPLHPDLTARAALRHTEELCRLQPTEVR